MSKEKNNSSKPESKPAQTPQDKHIHKREGAVKGNTLPTFQQPPPPPPKEKK